MDQQSYAIRLGEHGGPATLRPQPVDVPAPGPGQLRLRNLAIVLQQNRTTDSVPGKKLPVLLRIAGGEDEQLWRWASRPAVELGFKPGGVVRYRRRGLRTFLRLRQRDASSGRQDAALYGRQGCLPLLTPAG